MRILIVLQWAFVNVNQVWFVQMLYTQFVEWLVMRNLIIYQKDRSIGQIMYEHSNENTNEPIRNFREDSRYTLKQLTFRKREIRMKGILFVVEGLVFLFHCVIKIADIVSGFAHQVFNISDQTSRPWAIFIVVKRWLQLSFLVSSMIIVFASCYVCCYLYFVMKKKHYLEFVRTRKSMILQFVAYTIFIM